MPLPSVVKHGAQLCSIKSKRTGLPCRNPAAYGCRACRQHGARDNIVFGKAHPNWRHGDRSKEGMKQNSEKLNELRYLEDLSHEIGLMSGPKTCGRKPNT